MLEIISGADPVDTYNTYIYFFRHFTDIAAQWSVSDLCTLNFGDVAIFAATGRGMLLALSEAHDSALLEILSGAPISHASLPRNRPTKASYYYPVSHDLYCWLLVEMSPDFVVVSRGRRVCKCFLRDLFWMFCKKFHSLFDLLLDASKKN
jgi:hypothetical protein